MYDETANTWTETAIASSMVEDLRNGWGGVIRHSDNHLLVAAHNGVDTTTDDIQTWDVTPDSISGPTVTAKTNVVTNQAESGGIGIVINQQNDDVYVAYLKGGTWRTAVDVVYHKSDDGMATWGSESAYSEAAADDIRALHGGRSVDNNGGRIQFGFFNDDLTEIFVNLVNDIEIAAVPTAADLTLPIFTVDAIALNHADASLTLPILTVSSTAVSLHADASLTFPVLTVNSTAVATHGDASLTFPVLEVAATSLEGVSASLTFPLLEVLSTAVTTHGDVSLTLPVLTVAATAVTTHGDSSLTLPVLTVNATALNHADSSLTLAMFTMNNLAHLPSDGAFNLPLLSVQGTSGVSGDITLPLLEVAATATQEAIGADGSITLPIIILSARSFNGSPPDCVVLNTKNFAVSEYLSFGFNSYTRFNGVNLAANQNGIFEVDDSSLDESSYVIKAAIKTGIADTYTKTANRLRDSYIMYKSDGDIKLTSNADKKATRRYSLPENSDTNVLKKRRIKFERGIKDRHFDFKIENVNGSSLKVDKLTITLEPISSKRR
jgi:hypothetical protein